MIFSFLSKIQNTCKIINFILCLMNSYQITFSWRNRERGELIFTFQLYVIIRTQLFFIFFSKENWITYATSLKRELLQNNFSFQLKKRENRISIAKQRSLKWLLLVSYRNLLLLPLRLGIVRNIFVWVYPLFILLRNFISSNYSRGMCGTKQHAIIAWFSFVNLYIFCFVLVRRLLVSLTTFNLEDEMFLGSFISSKISRKTREPRNNQFQRYNGRSSR